MKTHSEYYRRNLVSILFGAIGTQMMYVFVTNYASIFFTDYLGIGAAAAGTIFLLSRIWDAINDPMCGIMLERSNPRFGKIPTWITGGGILTAIFLVLLFTVPDLSLTGRTIWGIVTYNGVGMAFTAVTVAVLLQIARGTSEPGERIRMNMAYTIGSSVVGIVISIVITKVLAAYQNTRPAKGYQVVAMISAVVGVIAIIVSAFCFKDQIDETEEEKETEDKPKVIEMIKAIIKVPSFIILVFAPIICNLGVGITISGLMYYFTYVLKNPALMGIILPATYISTLLGCSLSGYLSRFGKVTMLKVSCLLMVFGQVLRFAFHDAGISLILGYGIVCIGQGMLSTFLNPCLVDCADYAEYKTGVKCQALSLTGYTLVNKMSVGIGAAVLGFALQASGYISGAAGASVTQPESAVEMIRMMQFGPSIICALAGFGMLFFYKLDEKTMEEVYQAKKERTLLK